MKRIMIACCIIVAILTFSVCLLVSRFQHRTESPVGVVSTTAVYRTPVSSVATTAAFPSAPPFVSRPLLPNQSAPNTPTAAVNSEGLPVSLVSDAFARHKERGASLAPHIVGVSPLLFTEPPEFSDPQAIDAYLAWMQKVSAADFAAFPNRREATKDLANSEATLQKEIGTDAYQDYERRFMEEINRRFANLAEDPILPDASALDLK